MRPLILVVLATLLILSLLGFLAWRHFDTQAEFGRLKSELADHGKALADETWPRPPLPGDPVEGTARWHYAQAYGACDGTPEGHARALAFISDGTRTAIVGRDAFPVRRADLLIRLRDDHWRPACTAAVDAGERDRAARYAWEMVQFGTDLTRGNRGMERFYGAKLARSGAEHLAAIIEPGTLDAAHREWVETWRRGPRAGREVIAGMRLAWLRGYRRIFEDGPGQVSTGVGGGPLTDAGVPDAINPETISKWEIVTAWRQVSDVFDRLETDITWHFDVARQVRWKLGREKLLVSPAAAHTLWFVERRLVDEAWLEAETRRLLLSLLGEDE